ncbi:MAG: IPExxxVDY family protein [Bacteroidetes bacterium]|nr:IPExxxVDY family protein [Bacteroidota bacterium]
MKKRNKLIVDYDYNFNLIGMISPVKDYKLIWSINNQLKVRLVKNTDLILEYLNQQKLVISNFLFETENSSLRILKNKAEDGDELKKSYLLPELKNFDYFLMLEGSGDTFNISELEGKLKNLEIIQYLTKIDVSKLKSKENLVF